MFKRFAILAALAFGCMTVARADVAPFLYPRPFDPVNMRNNELLINNFTWMRMTMFESEYMNAAFEEEKKAAAVTPAQFNAALAHLDTNAPSADPSPVIDRLTQSVMSPHLSRSQVETFFSQRYAAFQHAVTVMALPANDVVSACDYVIESAYHAQGQALSSRTSRNALRGTCAAMMTMSSILNGPQTAHARTLAYQSLGTLGDFIGYAADHSATDPHQLAQVRLLGSKLIDSLFGVDITKHAIADFPCALAQYKPNSPACTKMIAHVETIAK